MVSRLTVDGGLLRAGVLLPAVKTLRAWEVAGRVELFETDRAKERPTTHGWPGAPVPSRQHPRSRMTKKFEAGSLSFFQVSAVLFPLRDPHRLDMMEVNDVVHLQRHHSLGHAIFVTTNTKNFIEGGKREKLQTAFKIVILTPEEAVLALEKTEGSRSDEKKTGPHE